MKRMLIAAATAAAVSAAALGSVQAADADAEAYVEYRKNALHATGGHMKAMATAMKSGINVPNRIADHARAIAFIMQDLPAAFPEGTAGVADTEALDKLWDGDNMKKFEMGANKSAEAAIALAEAAGSGDQKAMADALKELGGTCKACHENFRKE